LVAGAGFDPTTFGLQSFIWAMKTYLYGQNALPTSKAERLKSYTADPAKGSSAPYQMAFITEDLIWLMDLMK
jgi:hypothetical protein